MSEAAPGALAVRRLAVLRAMAGVALLGALALPHLLNDYFLYIVNAMLVYVVVAMACNLLLGYLGQLAFASSANFGIGAYGAAIAMERLALSYPAALLVGAAASGLAGFLLGLPALRLKRYSLALMTLAFVELMRWTYIHADALTGGSSGLAVPSATVLGIDLTQEGNKYYVFLVVTGVALAATRNLLGSHVGRAWVSIRENELAAGSLGIWPAAYKVLAFTWSGVLLGLGGGMFALLVGRVVPESFGLTQLLLHFTMVMVGGLGSLLGSVLGAVALTAVPELLRNFPGFEEILFSIILMAVLLANPAGIAGLLQQRWPWLRTPLARGSGR